MNPMAPPAPTSPAPPITASSPQTPTAVGLPAAPTYDPSAAIGAIRNYYQIPQQAGQQVDDVQVKANIADQQDKAAKAAKAAQVDMTDPNKYRIISDPTGKNATVILDPNGRPISVAEMSKATGTAPAAILKGSENTQEKQFAEAYQNYEGFMKSLMTGDTKTQQQYFQKNQGLKGMTPDKVRQLFMGQYGNYFGIQQQNVPYGVNRGFIPGGSLSNTGLPSYTGAGSTGGGSVAQPPAGY